MSSLFRNYEVASDEESEFAEKHRENVRKELARYLLVRWIVIVHSSFSFRVLTHPITG